MELEEELGLTFPDNVLDKPNLTMADVEKAIVDLASKESFGEEKPDFESKLVAIV